MHREQYMLPTGISQLFQKANIAETKAKDHSCQEAGFTLCSDVAFS